MVGSWGLPGVAVGGSESGVTQAGGVLKQHGRGGTLELVKRARQKGWLEMAGNVGASSDKEKNPGLARVSLG